MQAVNSHPRWAHTTYLGRVSQQPLLHVQLATRTRRRFPKVSVNSAGTLSKLGVSVSESLDLEMPLPPQENAVDDIRLNNPLQRMNRLSTGWFGVIVELDGVLIEDTFEMHKTAWLTVASEFGFPKPLGHLFRRVRGCKDEIVVQRIFNWTQNATTARQITNRKSALYEELLGGRQPAEVLEAKPFLETLRRNNIPIALACALPEARVRDVLKRINMAHFFDAVITAEDSGAPEVEFYYSYASQALQRPPIRCVVLGSSNTSVEGAHELGMKCVVVTGTKPVYEFGSADLVVRTLSQLTFFNMKRLFGAEDLVASRVLDGEVGGGGSQGGSSGYDRGEVDDPELDDFEFSPSGSMPPVFGAAFFAGR